VLSASHWTPDTSEPILDSTIAGILRDAAASAPDRVALVAGTADPDSRKRRTYAELTTEAEAVARTLAARFAPGDRLAVLAPSIPESLVLTFAAAMARLVLVPVNPTLRTQEVAHVLDRSGAAGVCFVAEHRGNDLAGVLAAVRPRVPTLRTVLSFEDDWPALVAAGVADDRPLPPPRPGDVAQIVFTSGTTGAPKGAMLTHQGLCNAPRLGGRRFGLGAGDIYVDTIPLFHVGGQAVAFQIVQAVATNVLLIQYDAGVHFELLESERATHTIGVPTMLLDVIDHPDFGRRDISALRSVSTGGAPVPAELIRHIEQTLDVQTTIVFGQTEACGFISQTFLDDSADDKATTVGRLLPQYEGRIIDPEHGGVVPIGELGELQIRGSAVMAGYIDEPEATAATIDPDGWLHTGDLATMDARGYLRVSGRLKDMIVTGGVNVFPVEIEAAIAAHPSVAEVAVLGVPHPRWGEAVVAFVRMASGEEADVGELETFTRERLAPYKVPKQWLFVDELPRNASGKVQKFILQAQLVRHASDDPCGTPDDFERRLQDQ
jgi:fatty-acyl-CoA synthase